MLPQWGPPRRILCIFEVRKKPSGTPFSVFLSNGGPPNVTGPSKTFPPPPSRRAWVVAAVAAAAAVVTLVVVDVVVVVSVTPRQSQFLTVIEFWTLSEIKVMYVCVLIIS